MNIMSDNDYLKHTHNLLTFIHYVRPGKDASRDFGTTAHSTEKPTVRALNRLVYM
jgi:hypothetical protein